MNSIEALYTASGKWYLWGDRMLPSAGTIVMQITKEQDIFDTVGIPTLEKAQMEGTGAHTVACDYSLMTLGHNKKLIFPQKPSAYNGTESEWDAAMGLALVQVRALFEKYKVRPIAVEQPAVCSMYGFGGQPDIKLIMEWLQKDIFAVWDYKRVAKLTLSHYLKIHAYRMLDGFTDCQAGFIAWLRKDGPAELIQVSSDYSDESVIKTHAATVNYQIKKRIVKP